MDSKCGGLGVLFLEGDHDRQVGGNLCRGGFVWIVDYECEWKGILSFILADAV